MPPVDPTIFVTLSYDVPTCAERPPAMCSDCRKAACVSTKEMKKSAFDARRTADFSACAVTASGDSYSVRCDNCITRVSSCQSSSGTGRREDIIITCTAVPGTYAAQCGWWR